MEDSLTPYLMASLRARAARRRAEGLERELQSMWDAAEAQRAWMAELQEDLTAALEDGQEQHDAPAALAKEVDALRARLAGALQTTSPPAHHMPTPSLRQARHSQLEESQAQHDAAAALAKEVDALRARLAGAANDSTGLPMHGLPSEAGPAQRVRGRGQVTCAAMAALTRNSMR